MQIITQNELETQNFAEKVSNALKGGDILCLHGELGAGKTSFVKGLAKSFKITSNIKSPTFSLMNIYNIPGGRLSLVHIDAYRLQNESELIEVGALDYIGNSNSITVIEWPEKIRNIISNSKSKSVFFKHTPDNKREITSTDFI